VKTPALGRSFRGTFEVEFLARCCPMLSNARHAPDARAREIAIVFAAASSAPKIRQGGVSPLFTVEGRSHVGHWEADTVAGTGSRDCIATLVKRKTGLVLVGKLSDRRAGSLSRRMIGLMGKGDGRFETVTADNGTEFHGYESIERHTDVAFYFARPYHLWERGSNENANGLLRQYLPKGESMAGLTQHQCNVIARKLNTRPRKRLGFRTPLECFNES
jgi:IS30 family transposase